MLKWIVIFGALLVLNTRAEPLSEPATVLVKKVVLVDRSGAEGEPQMVNLLVKKGQLELVSLDAIPEESVGLVVDARQGYVLGRLEVGAPANFMVLNQNPLEHFEALLDTRTHAVFVLRDGQIVKNQLMPPPPQESEMPETKREWFAYSAPPFALPTVYQSQKKWNRYEGKYINANFIAGLLLDRMEWLAQDGGSEAQVGELSPFNDGEIRALRFGVVGTFNFEHPWIYTFFVATHAFDQGFDSPDNNKVSVFDLRLDIPLLGCLLS